MPAAAVMLVITPYMTGQKPLQRPETGDAKLQSQSENDSASAKREFTDLFWDVRHRVLADFNVLNGAQRLTVWNGLILGREPTQLIT